jgi:ribose-phosphate pyrophosphokinase
MKRANRFAKGLRKRLGRNVPTAFVEKFRSGQDLSGGTLVGDVEGAVAVVVDDLIGTGGTICQATRACVRGGAEGVVAAVTHGVFVGDASEKLTLPDLDAIYVTNTIPPFRLAGSPVMDKLTVCDVSERFAAAIRAIHAGGSVTTLNEMEPTVRQPDAEGEDDGRASPETTQSAVEAEPNLTP